MLSTEVSKLWPAGQMQSLRPSHPACGHFFINGIKLGKFTCILHKLTTFMAVRYVE